MVSVLIRCANPIEFLSAQAEHSPQSGAECVIEAKSGRILYEYRGDTRLPMASTTKIATAITVLENCENVKREISIPPETVGVEGSSVYLQAGDMYSVEDLLYGLMLRSGNDCAETLAYFFGGVGNFAAKMNYVAQKAGALNTNFRNPHGLPCVEHYTTARDLSLITAYALRNPIFREIVSTKYYEPRKWQNKNKMLFQYEGAIGVKTGYTKQAGRCLVSAAARKGMELVCTVLNCPQTYERSTKLLDDAFEAFSYVTLVNEGDVFEREGIKGVVHESFAYPLMEGEREALETLISFDNSLQNGKIVGQIQICLAKRLIFSGNLYKL